MRLHSCYFKCHTQNKLNKTIKIKNKINFKSQFYAFNIKIMEIVIKRIMIIQKY